MAYKKYIKRDGKLYGPYVYHSRKEGGRVITDYHGKLDTGNKYLPIWIFLGLFLFALIGFVFFNFEDASLGSITSFTTLDDSENSQLELSDFLAINSENQQIEFPDPLAIIRFVIEIISAEHLDENREFVSDIYEETRELDDIWSEEISDGEFVRVTFEQNLTSENDITIFPRVVSGDPKIEVYEKDGTEIIAEFLNIISEAYNKIFLTNLIGTQDTFDLKILDGSLQFDYILDPQESLTVTACTAAGCSVANYNDNTTSIGASLAKNAVDDASISATTGLGGSDTINSVDLHFRWTNVVGLNGNWEIIPQSQDGLTNYCAAITIAQTNTASDEYRVVDIMTGCVDTKAELDDLRLDIKNVDVQSGQTGDVLYVNVTLDYTLVVDDSPTWSNPLVDDSTPNLGQTVVHNITWADDTALSYATLEINSTGANCDTTANVSSTSLSGTSDVADLSWTVENACEGKVIGWKQYANDSANQWNVTDLQTYTVNNIAPTASFGTNPVNTFNSSSSSVTFELKIADNLGVDYLRLYGDWGGSWTFNQTNTTPVNDTIWSVTVNGIPEGQNYNWAAWGNDTVGNEDFTDTNRTFTVDLTFPNVTINDPQNQSYITNSILFNVTSVDNFGLNTCTYSLNGGANVSLTNSAGDFWDDTNASMAQGSHTVTYYCTDFVGNVNGSEQVTFFIDSLNPLIEFVAPTEANGTSVNRQWIFANVTITETNFQNVTFKLFNSTGLLNETFRTTEDFEINFTGLSNDGVLYWYNVSTYDQYGNFNQTETRYITLTSDQPPVVNLTFPLNQTYNSVQTELNYTATDDSLDTCWYSIDGGASNITITCGTNVTGLNSGEGSSTWTIYANDSIGQESSDSVTFFVDSITPLIQFVSPTTATGNFSQNFIEANITASDTNLDTITIYLYNSTGLVQTNTSTNSTFFVNFTGLPDETYSLNATVNDTLNNVNQTETRTIILDTTNPTINYVAPTENSGVFRNQDYVLINVTAVDNNLNTILIRLYNSTNDLINTTSTSTSPNFINFSSLSDGLYFYNATANDTFGNSIDLPTNDITLDTTNPLIDYTTGTPANGSVLSQDFVFVNVTLTETNFQNITFRLYNSTDLVNETTYTTKILNINFTGLSDETYEFNVTIFDKTSNSNSTITRTVILDTGSPQITILHPQNTSYDVVQTQLNYSVSDPTLDFCWYNTGGSNSTPDSSCPNFTGLTSSEGSNTWTVYANDSSGNENSSSVTFTVDLTSPNIDFVFPTEGNGSSLTRNYIQVNVTASDSLTGLDTITIRLYNSTSLVNETSNVTSPFFVNFTNLPDETYFFNATANDTVGNENNTLTRTATIDTGPPTISYVSPTENSGALKNQNYVLVNVTASDPNLDTILIRLYNSTNDLINSTSTSTSPNFINFSGLSDGLYFYNATANDTIGNSADLATRNITLDTSPPTADFVDPTETNGSSLTRNYIQVNITSTDDTSVDTIIIRLYNSTGLVQTNTSTNPTFFVNFTNLPDENYFFNATVNDTAGNVNNTVTRTVSTDTGPPTIIYVSPTEDSGVLRARNYVEVNVTAGDPNLDKIVIRLYNSTGSQIRINISSTSPFFVNYTVLADGLYFYNATANDTFGNSNSTTTRNITLDATNPSITNIVEDPSDPAIYATGVTYEFNATITDDNLDTVLIEFNGVNYTPTQNGNVYNFTISDLAGGVHNYTWFANDTAGGVNTLVQTYTVNKATGVVFTYLNNSRANITLNQGDSIFLNGTLENGTGNIKLYNNGVLINQGASPLSNFTNFSSFGLFNITTIYDGNENFTSAFETWNVSVPDTEAPQIIILHPQNRSYTAIQTQLNYSVSDPTLDTCWYSIDGGANITINCVANVTGLNSSEGSSTWRIYANDTSGNENSSSVTFFVDSIKPLIEFVSPPTETSGAVVGRNYIQVNVTALDDNLDTITIFLYNSTGLVQTNTSSASLLFVNFTGLSADTYFFNATVNDTVGNPNQTETRNISLVVPNLTIIRPENETYFDTTELLLNFTVSFENFVWYNIDGGTNTTISGNTTFNASGGQRTLNLYANNTVGETVESIIFTIDLSKFKIIYDNYAGNTSGSSTDFNQSSFEDIQALSGVILENTDFGKIEFNEALNLTNDTTPGDNQLDLDTHTNISNNFIEINSSGVPNLNKSATLYLYGLTFSNPIILRDGVLCPPGICTKISYSLITGILVFNVTQFTSYSAEETPADAPTPGPSGGGGVSGGSTGIVLECTEDNECTETDEVCWNNKCVQLFDIKIIEFESPVELGEFFDFTYFIKGMAEINDDVKINFWIERNGEIISSGSDTIYIGSFEEKTEQTKIFLPSSVKSGVYTFYVEVVHDAYTVVSHRTIEIQVEDGGVFISSIKPGKFSAYLIVFFILIAFLIISLIFYTLIRVLQGLGKGYKLTFLISLLVLILGFVFYYFNIFRKLSNIRFGLPSVFLILDVILGIAILIGIIFILRKKSWFAPFSKFFIAFNKFLEKRRIEKKFKKKYKEKAKESKKIFKEKGKRFDLLKWVYVPVHKIGFFFTGLAHKFSSFFIGIYRSFRPLEKETAIETKKTVEKVEKGLFEFSRFIDDKGKSFVKKVGRAEKQLRGFKVPRFRLPKFRLWLKKSDAILKKKIQKVEKEFKGLRVPKPKFKFSKLRIKLPRLKIKLPKISLPKIKLPKFRLLKFRKEKHLLKKSDIALKKKIEENQKIFRVIKIPRFKLPKFRLPKLNFKFPKLRIKLPKFKTPKYKIEKDLFKKEKQWFRQRDKILRKKIKENQKIFSGVKVSKFKFLSLKIKLPKFKLPSFRKEKQWLKKSDTVLKREFREDKKKFRRIKLSKFKFKLPRLKIKLPKISLPKIKLPKFKLPKFGKEKQWLKQKDIALKRRFKEDKRRFKKIKVPRLKIKLPTFRIKINFPKLPKLNLIKQFEESDFAKESRSIKRREGILRKFVIVSKGLSKNKREVYQRRDFVKKSAVSFLNNLFSDLKRSISNSSRKEKKNLVKYSKEFNSAVRLSKRVFKNTKGALKKSNKVVHSAYSEIKRDMIDLRRNFEGVQRRQGDIRLKNRFFSNRFESKEKTAKRLADEVSREVKDSTKDNEMGDIIEDMAKKEKEKLD